MARLPKGWTRLKAVGDVETVLILVHRDSGKFGTSLDGETIRQWSTLAEAEAFVKDLNEASATEIMISYCPIPDQPPQLKSVRARQAGSEWVHVDGTRFHWNEQLYIPNAEAAAAVDAKRVEHEELKRRLSAIREEAWNIIHRMEKLPKA